MVPTPGNRMLRLYRNRMLRKYRPCDNTQFMKVQFPFLWCIPGGAAAGMLVELAAQILCVLVCCKGHFGYTVYILDGRAGPKTQQLAISEPNTCVQVVKSV